MKIATVMFTYCRSWHTEQVLTALKNNTKLPDKLIIFQDGLKNEKQRKDWEKVNKAIHSIEWCDTELVVSTKNRGCADSVIEGLRYAFQKYEAVIVIEDDCVPAPSFMSYMYQCLEMYENNRNVYCIAGYALPYPHPLPNDIYDVYASGRDSIWGWGTWKNRWNDYSTDCLTIGRIQKDREKSEYLATWGSDLADMFVGTAKGNIDAWDVFWSLTLIEHKGLCIYPYRSLIKNIGMDSSGTNCGDTDIWKVEMDMRLNQKFCLPENPKILDACKFAMAELQNMGSYTAIASEKEGNPYILVYGSGYYMRLHERELNEKYNITAFIDSWKNGYYAGRPMIKPNEIEKYEYSKIIIMIKNLEDCKIIKNRLVEMFHIPAIKIQIHINDTMTDE